MEAVRYNIGKIAKNEAPLAGRGCEEIVGELVERSVAGDIEAFGELYGIYLDRIYRYILYQVNDRVVAEDLTEEVFLKAWKGINRFTCKGPPFSSWLYRIAHNHIIDYFRTNRQLSLIDSAVQANSENPEEVVEEQLIKSKLLAAIHELPCQQQQIIILKFIEELDNKEIEDIIGKSQGAIRVMQMRALIALRQKLNGEVQYEG